MVKFNTNVIIGNYKFDNLQSMKVRKLRELISKKTSST